MFHSLVTFVLFLGCTSLVWSQECTARQKKYTVSSEKADWIVAGIKCAEKGMELASIETQADEKLLEQTLNNAKVVKGFQNGLWTSGRRHYNKGFVWFYDGKAFTYTNWAGGQPLNTGGVENCIEIFAVPQTKRYRWNDYTCGSKLRYICQTKKRCSFDYC